MNFINPFAFLANYFTRTGDNYNAKIGHVNYALEQIASSSFEYVEVPISSAQILALGSTPVELLPEPETNEYYDIDKIILEYTENTISYDVSAVDTILLTYNYNHIARSILDRGEDTITIVNIANQNVDTTPISLATQIINQRLFNFSGAPSILTTSGSPTLGDGTLLAKIWYKVKTKGTEL